MHTPIVTVLLPVANGERFLRAAVESVLAQTLSEFELVIINDGSTDSTREIIESFQDNRIVSYHCEKSGLAAALNFGLRVPRGLFIARMDADDICLPDRLKIQIGELRRHPELGALGGGVLIMDEAGRTERVYIPPTTHDEILKSILGIHKTPLIHSAVVLRKEMIVAVGGYNERFHTSQDLDLWLRLSEIGRLGSVPEIVLKLRKHPYTVSSTRLSDQLVLSMAARICYYLRQRGQEDPSRASGETWHSFTRIIKGEIAKSRLFDINNYREELRQIIHAGSFSEKLSELVTLVVQNPRRLDAFRFRQKYIQTLNRVLDSFGSNSKGDLNHVEKAGAS